MTNSRLSTMTPAIGGQMEKGASTSQHMGGTGAGRWYCAGKPPETVRKGCGPEKTLSHSPCRSGLLTYYAAAIRSGSRFATFGVPRPVTASQPGEAE